jgi:hypothetical protein
MKLFQIEEPDGASYDENAAGAAVGIDLAGARVAIALGGNAELLPEAEGEDRPAGTPALLLGLRSRAEKQLARPVTHAVIVTEDRDGVLSAAQAAGLSVLRLMRRAEAAALAGGAAPLDAPALGAAIVAEDLAPPAGT